MTSPVPKPPHLPPPQLLAHLNYLRGLHLQSPKVGNTYLQDQALQQYTAHTISNNPQFLQFLTNMGDRLSTIYIQAARNAQQNHPRLQQFDSYGKRIDKLHLSEGWQLQKKYAAQDGIVALAYQQDKYKLGNMQRYGQLVNLYMYHPVSGLYGCPLAMTDGAAYTIKNLLQTKKHDQKTKLYLQEAYTRLTSRTDAWTSGQWMTQKKGGSDVSNTQTIAVHQQENFYRLYGYKWFTSATDSQMTLALAKILPKGMKPTPQNLKDIKVSLFYVKLRTMEGTLNNMQIIRLKDKLGTRQLPTAQILLKGTQALLISDPEQGVKMISKMLTITRIYNSATAVGIMRFSLALAKDYASRRVIGKTLLSSMPLQLRVLSHLEVMHRGNLMLYLRLAELFSKEHHSKLTSHEANILRVMVPIMKLFTGKQSLVFVTQVLQSFGGMGYIQGSMLPSMLRDAQVLSIWQGTTNVLCYDFVRAMLKKQNQSMPIASLVKHFLEFFDNVKLRDIENPRLTAVTRKILQSYTQLFKYLNKGMQTKFRSQMAQLRTYCFGLARLFIACELLGHFFTALRQKDLQVVERWVDNGIFKKQQYDARIDKELALSLDQRGKPACQGEMDSRGKLRSKL